jgi:hypothetical protein
MRSLSLRLNGRHRVADVHVISRADQHLNDPAIDGGPGSGNSPTRRGTHKEERVTLMDGLSDRNELEGEDLTRDGRADHDGRLGMHHRNASHGRHHDCQRRSSGPPPVLLHAITSP